MTNSRISVIIPVYNAENYLHNLMKDLLEQTYTDMEIILIDDGSTDNSWHIMQSYADLDMRISVIKTGNKGPSAARNVGLSVAKGTYVRFIDADDRVPNYSMEKMIAPFLDNEKIDLVLGNYTCFPMKNYFMGEVLKNGDITQQQFINHFIRFCKSFYYGAPWNKLYKRQIIENSNIRFDESMLWCEDFLFNVAYYSKCKNMYYINVPNGIYQYCLNPNSITYGLEKKGKIINFKMVEKTRYNSAYEYCKLYGQGELFVAEWKNASLYDLLSASTKRKYNKSYRKRFHRFVQLLNEDGVYQYIDSRQEDFDLKIWKDLKHAIDKNSYIKSFLFFYFKGVMATYFEPIMPFLRQKIQPFLPKSL